MLEAIDARRSVSSRHLAEPAPDDATLLRMLRSAVRVPDHGKRVPFRFIRIAGDARIALGDAVAARGLALRPDAGDGAVEKDRLRFTRAPLVVAVIAVFDDADTAIPAQERLLTAGSVCFACAGTQHRLRPAGAGWPAYDADVLRLLGLGVQERIAGFIHIGTPIQEANERDRPDPAALLGDWSPPA